MTPASDWKEVVAPDEAARFEALGAQLGAVQRRCATATGVMRRALHAKANLAAFAQFEVLDDTPDHARVGLFAEPRTYQAVVRFSNGSSEAQKDSTPDVRGIAVKVIGATGRKLIPQMEDCLTQDFLGILSPTVPFRTPEEFVWVVAHAASPAILVAKAVLHFGPSRAFELLGALQRRLRRPVSSLAGSHYFGALPMRFGVHAVKYTLAPVDVSPLSTTAPDLLGEALARQLEAGPLKWDFKVQFYLDENETPIEDPTADWPSPWQRVARLTLPRQSVSSERGKRLGAWVEALSFDPWHALELFRPLGAMMRARGPAYRVSGQARKAAPEPTEIPAELLE